MGKYCNGDTHSLKLWAAANLSVRRTFKGEKTQPTLTCTERSLSVSDNGARGRQSRAGTGAPDAVRDPASSVFPSAILNLEAFAFKQRGGGRTKSKMRHASPFRLFHQERVEEEKFYFTLQDSFSWFKNQVGRQINRRKKPKF